MQVQNDALGRWLADSFEELCLRQKSLLLDAGPPILKSTWGAI